MNRSITLVGVFIILVGFALVASPIVLTGSEQFDLTQEAGIFLAPIGLLVVLIGAVQANPELTTVAGTFGNPDAAPRRPTPERSAEPAPRGFSPKSAVDCRYCRTVIPYDLAFCPRCARPRECRGCGRVLGVTEDRTDCPGCHRVEAFCNCPRLNKPTGSMAVRTGGRRRP
jgi:RNA polymerase subunit RPABC4/transcription elongation factor Spt4